VTAEQLVVFVAFPVAGYLLGSVPFAWVVGKMKGVDIRTVGSKNIGATNLGRTLGKHYFVLGFLLDAGKGFFPVLAVSLFVRHYNAQYLTPTGGPYDMLGQYLGAFNGLPHWAPLVTAAACFLGHLFPVWLGFKGGKGVATSFGVVLGYWPLYTVAGLAAGLIFVVVRVATRYISVSSIVASVAFAVLVAGLSMVKTRYVNLYVGGSDRVVVIAVAAFFAAMIVWRHRGNIGRLMQGTEPQIGKKERDKAKMDGA